MLQAFSVTHEPNMATKTANHNEPNANKRAAPIKPKSTTKMTAFKLASLACRRQCSFSKQLHRLTDFPHVRRNRIFIKKLSPHVPQFPFSCTSVEQRLLRYHCKSSISCICLRTLVSMVRFAPPPIRNKSSLGIVPT